jgi:hypothetical protein
VSAYHKDPEFAIDFWNGEEPPKWRGALLIITLYLIVVAGAVLITL